ncbi:HlyD family secretion protein [Rosenbergiella epipactidis]|uniref:HlyD family secretion protein n=1 Tax=Rosenbergiella epipactidis TaxID=1544694 RepID=UPI0006646F0E|nr:HlyD family secretion protein [Rosenbergiella epipactidis]KMV72949.1 EmrA [bacteria symbiont BFo2 of Frankliniella occidentalis]KYP87663.1 EmrA [bacteria symbiont BFo2 of Frankliniella occidentalis]KYP95164.1 EmrA [bacteria symbiont BFo2 of Frankliniella occidentalis]
MTDNTRDDREQDAAEQDQDTQSTENENNDAPPRQRPGKKPLIILAIIAIIILCVAVVFWLMNRGIESTDDAFTDGNAATIAPKISGYVVNLNVKDNQFVHQGDLLVVIDPRDATAQREQAQAQLGSAQAQLQQAQAQYQLAKVQYPAQLHQALADQAKAKANLANAQSVYQRQHGVDPRATTQSNIDSATSQYRAAQADYQQAQAQVEIASQVPLQLHQQETAITARQQQVAQAEAQLATAKLNVSYTEVRAPYDGYVTKRNVQVGSLVQAGTALFSLVSPQIWVTANFKESQLEHMHPGNKVTVSVDAWPDLKLEGHVDSIQMGSGSHFSAFPAENATGNFVKIVQRVPVKIIIDKGLDPRHPLPLGLSVEPEVHVDE